MLSTCAELDSLFFEDLRAREFARLDRAGVAYLDFAASGQHAASQAIAYANFLADGVFGNPHSEHQPSRDSSAAIAAAREALLDAVGLSAEDYAVCFTANTSAAIKLVAEAWPFGPRRGLILSQDNHNSVNGMREFARRAGAPVQMLPLAPDLRLDDAEARLAALPESEGGLFAFPAQSNFSGVRHPLRLAAAAKARGHDVLIDAAGLSPGGCAALCGCRADFIALSFYKLFGLPTGVGALLARHEALARLRRPWFAGGTVDFVSVELDRHQLQAGAEGFHDGTPNFLGIAAVPSGFALLRALDPQRIGRRLDARRRAAGRAEGPGPSFRRADGAAARARRAARPRRDLRLQPAPPRRAADTLCRGRAAGAGAQAGAPRRLLLQSRRVGSGVRLSRRGGGPLPGRDRRGIQRRALRALHGA
jgi:selenocysteine lyase/cysteine desulfurase